MNNPFVHNQVVLSLQHDWELMYKKESCILQQYKLLFAQLNYAMFLLKNFLKYGNGMSTNGMVRVPNDLLSLGFHLCPTWKNMLLLSYSVKIL